jgi:hypothetical protein
MDTLFEVLGVYDWVSVPDRIQGVVAPPSYRRHTARSIGYGVQRTVEQLIDAQLLKADDPTDRELEHTKIGVTPLLRKIQTALDLSLTFLATVDRNHSMTVKPLFGIPDAIVEKLDVFVLMPFKADMLPVYEDHIKAICTNMELTVQRADDFFTANRVVEDV